VSAAIGQLIRAADDGDGVAATQLFAALYEELHALAERHLRRSGTGLTLGTTTLLHEAYLDLVGHEDVRFPDRARFLAYASRVMRSLIIDYVRRRRAKKRGWEFHLTVPGGGQEVMDQRSAASAQLDRLSDALDTLGEVDRELAELVDLHFFCGFSLVDIAAMRGVSDRTVQRDWRKARLVLHGLLKEP
jgi:RNA polymerase sigma factor (TIGR02999 family)